MKETSRIQDLRDKVAEKQIANFDLAVVRTETRMRAMAVRNSPLPEWLSGRVGKPFEPMPVPPAPQVRY